MSGGAHYDEAALALPAGEPPTEPLVELTDEGSDYIFRAAVLVLSVLHGDEEALIEFKLLHGPVDGVAGTGKRHGLIGCEDLIRHGPLGG